MFLVILVQAVVAMVDAEQEQLLQAAAEVEGSAGTPLRTAGAGGEESAEVGVSRVSRERPALGERSQARSVPAARSPVRPSLRIQPRRISRHLKGLMRIPPRQCAPSWGT